MKNRVVMVLLPLAIVLILLLAACQAGRPAACPTVCARPSSGIAAAGQIESRHLRPGAHLSASGSCTGSFAVNRPAARRAGGA